MMINAQSSPRLLLSLVGEQPVPNLLPLWQFADYDEVQFVASPTTRPIAKQLKTAIRHDPALSHLKALKTIEVGAYEIGNARSQIANALVRQQAQGKIVHLNLTGGTKLMSLAALQAAYGSGATLLYVSTEEKQIIWLASDGSEQQRQPIDVHISVEQYLNAHGFEIIPWSASAANRPPKEGDELEETVFTHLKQNNRFDDVCRNLMIRKTGRKLIVKNELDVVVTRNGRLAVISCRSSNVESQNGREAYRRAIYELSAISRREAAGIYCGKVLVSNQKELPKAIRDRAIESGIRLVYGDQIARLDQHVLNAIRG